MKEKSTIRLTTHSLVQPSTKRRAWTDKVTVQTLLLKGGIRGEEMFQITIFIYFIRCLTMRLYVTNSNPSIFTDLRLKISPVLFC